MMYEGSILVWKERIEVAYMKEALHLDRLTSGKLNMVLGGCGTGKTTWAINELPQILGIEPRDVLFITSRAITAAQLRAKLDGLTEVKSLPEDETEDADNIRDYALVELQKNRVHVFTMSTFGKLLSYLRYDGFELLRPPKLLIVDEIHALFTDVTFMTSARDIITYIADLVLLTNTPVVGLTATPFFLKSMKFPYVMLNDIVFQYHAAHTIITDFKCVSRLVVERFTSGRTIIMCPDIKHCTELAHVIPNSFVLISKNAKGYTSQMDWVRNYIVDKGDLPETYPDICGRQHPLNVLIGTSTLREGFNLSASSGVKHVVSCCNDATSIVQFTGRVRDDIDDLVIAYTFSPNNNSSKCPKFMREEVAYFRDFFTGNYSNGWKDCIADLRADPNDAFEFYDVEPLIEAYEGIGQREKDNEQGLKEWQAQQDEQKKSFYKCKRQSQAKSKRANQAAFKAELESNWLDKKLIAKTDEVTALFKLARDTYILQSAKLADYTLTKIIKEIKRLGYSVATKNIKYNGRWVQCYTITKPGIELTDS